MLKALNTIGYIGVGLLLLYLVVNIEIVIWEKIEPRSAWDIYWFIFTSISVLIIIPYIPYFVLLFFAGFYAIKKKKGIKKKLIIFATGIGITTIGLLSLLSIELPTFIIFKSVSDKYKLIISSEKLIEEGKYRLAIDKSKKEYLNASNDTLLISPIWFIQYQIENSKTGRKKAYRKYIEALNNYAYCLLATKQDIDLAELLYKESIHSTLRHFPDRPDYLLHPYTMLFNNSLESANFQMVEYYHEKIKTISFELTDEDIIYAVNNLLLYSNIAEQNGDIGNAMNIRKHAFDIYEQSEKSKKSSYYLSLTMVIASDFIRKGEFEKGKELLYKISKIAKKKKDSHLYISYLYMMAQINIFNNNLDESEKFLKQIVKITKNNQGHESYDFANALASLGVHYFRKKNYFKAAEAYATSIGILETHFPLEIVDYHKVLFSSGLNDFYSDKIDVSYSKMQKVRSHHIAEINQVFSFLTPEEKEGYVEDFNKRFRYINSIFIYKNDSNTPGEIYNNILCSKSIALLSDQLFKNQLETSGNFKILKDFDSIQHIKERIKLQKISLQLSDSDFISKQEFLRKKEREVMIKLSETNSYKKFIVNAVSWDDIRKQLQKDETAIEIVNIPLTPSSESEDRYYALVIRSSDTLPHLVPLFIESELSRLLDKKGNTFDKITAIYTGESLKEMYQLIWGPIIPLLKGINKVNLSVSGILHTVSFAALLQNEEMEIKLLSTTRNIVDIQGMKNDNEHKKTILYGDIDYNNKIIQPSLMKSPKSENINGLYERVDRAGYTLLPKTILEVNAIAEILNKKGYDIEIKTGVEASETDLREAQSKEPYILHIATHGFYFSPEQKNRIEEIIPVREMGNDLADPLFRSGLLFSGANVPEKKDLMTDGILTAFEISRLNFSKTDLVVLSACETGLGDIISYEGVFGLQRAFKLSGVKSLIVSLWKVPDDQTAELFQNFYKNYAFGMSKEQSLKAAQSKMKQNYSPFYWAAFQLID